MNLRRSASSLISLLALVGCASMPTTGTESNGQPLRVDPEQIWRWNLETKKIGEEYSVHEDDRGRLWLKKDRDIEETSLTGGTVTEWRAHQGDSPLDDEDFFKIAGRPDTAAQVHAERESGVLWNRIGLALIGGGAASLAGGAALVGNDNTKGVGIGLILGGLILIPGGGYEMLRGAVKTSHQLTTPGLALYSADQFNRALAAARVDPVPEPTPELTDAPVLERALDAAPKPRHKHRVRASASQP